MNKKPRSFKMVVAKAIAFPILMVGGLFLGMVVAGAPHAGTVPTPVHVPTKMERMAKSLGCGGGGFLPTGVVVTPASGDKDTYYTMNRRITDHMFSIAIGKKDMPKNVDSFALCK